MSDEDFLNAFVAGRLAREDFHHRAHLRAAWLMLHRYPLDEAIERTCDGIARLAMHLGAAEKFNRTVSEALIRLMSNACASGGDASFDEYLAANEWLVEDMRGVLAQYYSPDRLYSAEAMQRFLTPDLQALP
jgi:hypothetical protein